MRQTALTISSSLYSVPIASSSSLSNSLRAQLRYFYEVVIDQLLQRQLCLPGIQLVVTCQHPLQLLFRQLMLALAFFGEFA